MQAVVGGGGTCRVSSAGCRQPFGDELKNACETGRSNGCGDRMLKNACEYGMRKGLRDGMLKGMGCLKWLRDGMGKGRRDGELKMCVG